MPWVAAVGIAIAVVIYVRPPWQTARDRLFRLDLESTREDLAARPFDHAKRLELARYYLNWGLMIEDAEEPEEDISTDTALREVFEKRLDEWESMGEDVANLRAMLQTDLPLFRQEFVARERNLAKVMFDQSVLLFRQARALGARLTPRDLNDLGTAYYRMGPEGYAGASAAFSDAIEAGLVSTHALVFLGDVEFARRNIDRSVQYYRKALEYKPEDPVITFNLGLAQKELRDFAAAAEYFRTTLELFHDREDLSEDELTIILQARLSLGWCLIQTKEFDDAVAELEAMVGSQPDSLEANYWLGIAYAGLGRIDAARLRWQRVVELEPEFRDARALVERLGKAGPASGRRG